MKPYLIAEIAYDPTSPTPWYVVRSGTVAEQGGLAVGKESVSFETIQEACIYLSNQISVDVDVIKDLIKKKEHHESSN